MAWGTSTFSYLINEQQLILTVPVGEISSMTPQCPWGSQANYKTIGMPPGTERDNVPEIRGVECDQLQPIGGKVQSLSLLNLLIKEASEAVSCSLP